MFTLTLDLIFLCSRSHYLLNSGQYQTLKWTGQRPDVTHMCTRATRHHVQHEVYGSNRGEGVGNNKHGCEQMWASMVWSLSYCARMWKNMNLRCNYGFWICYWGFVRYEKKMWFHATSSVGTVIKQSDLSHTLMRRIRSRLLGACCVNLAFVMGVSGCQWPHNNRQVFSLLLHQWCELVFEMHWGRASLWITPWARREWWEILMRTVRAESWQIIHYVSRSYWCFLENLQSYCWQQMPKLFRKVLKFI